MLLKSTTFVAATISLVLLTTVGLRAQSADAVLIDSARIGHDLGHGFNLGNALEAPKNQNWGVTIQESYFTAMEQAGCTIVRVPISWPEHALQEAPYTIEPEFFEKVDGIVAQAKSHHLRVVLDFHNYDKFAKDPAGQEARFLGLWKQVAEHYQSEPPEILFEIYNEPADKLDAKTWNEIIVKALAVIRPTNPSRLVVVGGVHWNGIEELFDLALPDNDRNIVVTFHYYDPMKFTHQGASWIEGSGPWLGTTWQGTDAEKQTVDHNMNKVAAWGKAHRRPIYMGEFGSFEKAGMESRVRWTQYVAQSANIRGFAWTYWEFCSGFGAFDPRKNKWREPLLHALFPDAKP